MLASALAQTRPNGAWREQLEPIVRHAGWFAFFLILAPIIGPRGYGIFAMALSGVAIVEALLVEPIVTILTGIERLEDKHLSTALVSAVSLGAAISLLLFTAAGQMNAMLDDAPLGDIVQSLSLLPVLGALGAVPTAVLRRRGKAGPFVAATTAGLCAGGGVAVALALADAGPWSLVAQVVVQRFVECGLVWGIAAQRIGLAWSRRHFQTLLAAVDLGALRRAWPVLSRHAPCLLIGLVLGPIATGLYMLAARFTEAFGDILLAAPRPARRALLADWAREIGEPLRRVALPAILGSVLLPVALPPIIDIRWWGAVAPAQIMLLCLIPAAASTACATAVAARNETRRRAVQAIGGIAVVALVIPDGLVAVASIALAWATAVALVGLWPLRREFGVHWQHSLLGAIRPLLAAGAAGLVLLPIVEPVALALTPVPALCLLAASGRLCYLLLSGEPAAFRQRLAPAKPA